MKPKRIFIPGDEWLYYKIYCGARTSDLILTTTIKPLIDTLKQKGWIDKWFFIRYNDPDFHIRIRFHVTDTKHIGSVILAFNESIKSYVNDDIIYKVQTDTYIRELERYGSGNIENSEYLFHRESEMLLQAIELIDDDDLYFIFILKAIDSLLESFHYTLEDKLNLAKTNKESFWKEFNGNKQLTKQLDKKYRLHKEQLLSFVLGLNLNAKPLYQVLEATQNTSSETIQNILTYLDKSHNLSKNQLISSYIHMLVNRAFRSKQRFYELVCYDFLYKYYLMNIHRK
ncbi:thiopeptide-type bacteriocin biosynthesis protein [Aquimarina sp. MMG016]|uniref:thiopeptide-type bacteriocin biosynthesis protein n=1 Tax=Aquimarina sp. MMG016 TaxID=2822690 RepID=UPI001B3A1143|nr:thiopeptide-type bacteriocin biosynthesis protein [Aquimarina sp. MMG016]MBQ4818847.1 thiopeptide-type bacteriocin biosynthesis protein [Aquimarina sp. MMG016]